MTVRREQVAELPHPAAAVREAVDAVLAGKPYRVVDRNDYAWSVTIVPAGWPLILSTRLWVSLEDRGAEGTRLSATTTSQRLLAGDVAGMYRSYLERFFRAVDQQLASA